MNGRDLLRVLTSLVILLGPASLAHASPEEVYKKAIHSVVWIANDVPREGVIAYGSGALIDRERRLVITNYHVTHGEQRMDVYFAATGTGGLPIDDRSYYTDNYDELHRLGYATAGVVVAQDPSKDLAILRVSSIPTDAVAMELCDDEPDEGDSLNVIGNPAARELWRWSGAKVEKIERFTHQFADDGLAVDFRAVRVIGTLFQGNSGGPILNEDGELVAVCESSSSALGGMFATGVHYREVRELLDSVLRQHVFNITNRTENAVSYTIKYGEKDWESKRLEPGQSTMYWTTSSSRAQIRFDYSYEDGFQPREYTLDDHTAYYGRGCKPDRELDARAYEFQPRGNGLDLVAACCN